MALVVTLVSEMPVLAVARFVGEHDTRLWRVVKHYVGEAGAEANHSEVRSVGVDEKACRRGHDYVTLFADLDRGRLVYATEGRSLGVLGEFREGLKAHGGRGEQIEELCMDMSLAYLEGTCEAVDAVRRQEQKKRPELKRTRWMWLWNPERLCPR